VFAGLSRLVGALQDAGAEGACGGDEAAWHALMTRALSGLAQAALRCAFASPGDLGMEVEVESRGPT